MNKIICFLFGHKEEYLIIKKIKLFISNYKTIEVETDSKWLAFKLSIKVLLRGRYLIK